MPMIYYNGKAYGGRSSGAAVNYSVEEHVFGTWIDGSVLYEKTVFVGNIPEKTGNEISLSAPSGITEEINFACVKDIWYGYSTNDIDHCSYGTQFYNPVSGNYIICYFNKNTKAVRFKTSASTLMGVPVYVTLQYTKR